MKKLLQIGNIVAFLLMVIVNYYANTGAINSETMGSVAGQYENLFTPADYTFSIWGVIYIFLLGFVIYQAHDLFVETEENETVHQIGWWFIFTCVLNIAWIFAWLNFFPGISVILMSLLLFCLIRIIWNCRLELDDEPLSKIVFLWWPFSLYSGWISVALIANVASWLDSIGWGGFGIAESAWSIIMIIIAGTIHLIITWTRNMREFALVGAWALVGIAVANWSKENAVTSSALIVASILFLSSSFHAYKNRKYAPWKKL